MINAKNISIRDTFWSGYQDLVTENVIPYQEKVLRDEVPGAAKSHALANFRITAGLEEGNFYGMVFQDSDVAKWLEGTAFSLLRKPDPELERRADEIIEVLALAQREDGYLNTYFALKEPGREWTNLEECHELYCAGHLMEAAAAYYTATGKDRLLNIAERLAAHIINRFGTEEGKHTGVPGHQEIELGLLRLYEVTGRKEYLDEAVYFLKERGTDPDFFVKEAAERKWVEFGMDPYDREYSQIHAPVYDQSDAVGHSVRAVYMYTAMAEAGLLTGDERMLAACRRLFDSIVKKRMYITGGIGSTVKGEAFTIDYDLPNDTAYAESCASVGLVFFTGRLLDWETRGEYADTMERALFNGVLSGMQLDGKRFFYVNPLEVEPGVSGVLSGFTHVMPVRQEWYPCACCPPNIARLVESLGKYLWTENKEGIYSHLFVGQEASFEKAEIRVKSSYPFGGSVTYEIISDKEFELGIHIPGWIRPDELQVTLDGEDLPVRSFLKDGYLRIRRGWNGKAEIRISFPMHTRYVYANPLVREDSGKAAVMRGPLVYCAEGVDHDVPLQTLYLPYKAESTAFEETEGPLKGMTLLKIRGMKLKTGKDLYSEEPSEKEETEITAVPYFAWGNRGEGQMRVWLLSER